MNTAWQKLRQARRYSNFPLGVYGLLVVVIVAFFAATQGSISPSHLLNIVRQAAPLGVVAMGQTIVLLVGGIDLSVGASMSMVNLVCASMMAGENANIPQAVAVSMLLCLAVGLVNGFIVARFRMQPFLVTMAMSMIIEGGYYIYTKGVAKGSIASGFRWISEGWLGILPVAGIIWVALWALLSVVLHKTTYGRKLYITGGNQAAAHLSGFADKKIVISAYVLSALLAGVAGLLLSAYIGTASTGVGNDYTLNSIAATVIGGTAFSGGIGSLEGTFPGVLITLILQSMMTILGISEAGKFITQGVVIAVMVAINQLRGQRR